MQTALPADAQAKRLPLSGFVHVGLAGHDPLAGRRRQAAAGLCMSCYRRWRYSALFFGGNRDSALEHDGRARRGCQSQHYLNVHHRRPGDHTQLVTLCAGCHAWVHRTRTLRHCLPEILVDLWREWHPDAIEQLQLPLEMSVEVPVWSKYSCGPAIVPE